MVVDQRIRSGRALAAALVLATGLAVPSSAGPPPPPHVPVGEPVRDDPAAALALARDTGRPVEVSNAGTPTSQVFANPGGSFTARLHARPVRTRGPDGRWVPVDPTLRREPGGRVVPTAATVDLALSGGGEAPLASLGTDFGRLTLSWPGPLPAPVLAGDTATYPEALPGVDLVLYATPSGFGEVVVVKNAQAARHPALAPLRFGLTAPGLTLRADPQGGAVAVDERGRTALTVGAGWMWDSSAGSVAAASRVRGPVRGDRVARTPIRTEPGGLVVTPDAAMLADLGLTFPVYLDPLIGAERQHWVMVEKDLPSYGWWDSAYQARVGRDPVDSTTDRFRSYFQLNLEPLADKRIKKAILSFDERWRYSCSPEPVYLWWTGIIGSGTTWQNAPALTGSPLGVVYTPRDTASCEHYGKVEFDVRALVSRGAAERWPHVTFALASDESATANGGKVFGNNPFIDVEYNTVPEAPVQVATGAAGGCPAGGDAAVNTATPELKVRLVDADAGQPTRATVEWREVGAPASSTLDTAYGEPGTERSVVVPSDRALIHDRRYEWRARAYNEFPGNDVDVGPWSGWCPFVVDLRAPATRPIVTVPPGTEWREDVPVHVTFSGGGDPDVAAFQYTLNGAGPVRVPAQADPVVVRIVPTAYLNSLMVSPVDRAGNVGTATATATLSFDATPLPVAAGYWPMEDWFGDTISDWSGANYATLAGGYEWVEGFSGGAVHLDGAADTYAETSGPVLNTDASFTVAAWVRLDATTRFHTVVAQSGARREGFALRYDLWTGTWAFLMRSEDADSGSEATVRSNTRAQPEVWTHLAGVYDHEAGQLRLYVNGRLAGAAAHRSTWNAQGPFGFGYLNRNGNREEGWVGALDEVKAYPFAATERKIREDLPAGWWGPRAWWEFDQGMGRTAADSEYQGHSLFLEAGAGWLSGGGRLGGSALHLSGETAGVPPAGPHAYTAGPVVRTDASFTVAAWVRLDRDDTWYTAVSQDGDRDSGFTLGYSVYPRGWAFTMNVEDAEGPNPHPAVVALSDTREQVGVWTHLAGVYDHQAGQLRLYVNGRLAGTVAHTGTRDFSGALAVGRALNNGLWVDHWPGDIDEVRISGEALSPAGIRAWMRSTDAYGRKGQWGFDESDGPALDGVPGNGHTMVLAGAARAPGKRGSGLRFAGAPAQAYTAGPVARTDASFTVAAWVKLDRAGAAATAVSQDGVWDSGFALGYDGTVDRWSFIMSKVDGGGVDPVVAVRAAAAPQTGVWTHLAGVYDALAGEVRLYVDGALAGTVAHRGTWNATRALHVGRGMNNGEPVDWWPGDVDEVRVVDWPMAAEEVRALLVTTPLGPGGWWRLDETTGTGAEDSSGNGHPLALTGGATRLAFGRCGGALALDGSTGQAASPQGVLRTDQSFTVTAWVRLATRNRYATVFGQDGVQRSRFQLSWAGQWQFIMYRSDQPGDTSLDYAFAEAAPDPAASWTHLAAVFDADRNELRLYVNGQPAVSGTHRERWAASGPFVLGRGKADGAFVDRMSGDVDEVRAVQRVLTDSEILDAYGSCDNPSPVTGRVFENPTDVPIADSSTVESTVTVTAPGGNAPANLRIDVRIRHTYRGDLAIVLVAPSGRTYRLKEAQIGDSADDVLATYTVNASAEPAGGVWRLRVEDRYAGDTGWIDSWGLTF